MKAKHVRLERRPDGFPTSDILRIETIELPDLAPGQVRVRNLWMSVDPVLRTRLDAAAGGLPPIGIGETLPGYAIGEIEASASEDYRAGDTVFSQLGWREAFVADARDVRLVDAVAGLPLSAHLGPAGISGLTGYFAVEHYAELREGDVVLVSAATSMVGSIACQFAKIRGHKVIAIVGNAEKADYVAKLFAADVVIDRHNSPNLREAIGRAAPEGIDVFIDSVGGALLEAGIANMNPFGRIVSAGMFEVYNMKEGICAPRNLFQIIPKRLSIQGIVGADHLTEMPRFLRDVSHWYRKGQLCWKESIYDGIEAGPQAFIDLMEDRSFGKALVRLG
jgi:NADPH-dependent curcumin reductase CurA